MPTLALATMEKLLKKNGAKRVSEEAKIELRNVLEEYADKLCKKAIALAEHAKRTTVKASDIKLALRE